MKLFFLITFLICLLCVFLQDLKYRKINVIFPVAIFVSSCFIVSKDIATLAIVVFNIIFLLLTIGLMILYMSIKNSAFINPFENYFGLGDLLMLIAITPLFLLKGYIIFFITSMVLSIVAQLIVSRFTHNKTVPLAGYIALLLIFVTITDLSAGFSQITILDHFL